MEYNHDDPENAQDIDNLGVEEEDSQPIRFQERIIEQMGSTNGRQLIWGLLDMQPPLAVPGSEDAFTHGFLQGRKSITAHIMAILLEECPELYITMQTEAKELKDE